MRITFHVITYINIYKSCIKCKGREQHQGDQHHRSIKETSTTNALSQLDREFPPYQKRTHPGAERLTALALHKPAFDSGLPEHSVMHGQVRHRVGGGCFLADMPHWNPCLSLCRLCEAAPSDLLGIPDVELFGLRTPPVVLGAAAGLGVYMGW